MIFIQCVVKPLALVIGGVKIILLLLISLSLVSCTRKEDLEVDSFYESEDYDFSFQYPSQWTIVEVPWHPATETTESDPEKNVNLYISGKDGAINAYAGEEGIVIFDSLSHDGGLFRLTSGEKEKIINTLGITGTMITEIQEVKGQTWIQILAYYEDGYAEGIGMGGSYGACAIVKDETYKQYGKQILEILKSVHMKQS